MERTPKSLLNSSMSCSLAKLIIFFLLTFASIFTFFDLHSLTILPLSSSSSSSLSSTSWSSLQQWKSLFTNNCSKELSTMSSKLKDSVTFLPLKDTRFAEKAMIGNTWFMSSLTDIDHDDEVEHLYFPSDASKGRLLCLIGSDAKDGEKNSYGFAWRDNLPNNATFMKGLTFVSDTYYDYSNIWHALSAMAPFAGWSVRNGCVKPSRWVLYHWGETRTRIGSWIKNLMEAALGEVEVEAFGGDGAYCFEKAIVMRHNIGKMGKEKKLEMYDFLRCKARRFCNVSLTTTSKDVIKLTLLLRKGARSFKNESEVIQIFNRECTRVEGCTLTVAQSENLDFCQQVKLLSGTDIVASPHGAQMTNMLFMERNSSVMEFFPNGWLELAGVGQYVHHWLASHSGMIHQGAWWDPQVEKQCPYPEKDPRCFSVYKNGKVGQNETFFAEWARDVINKVKLRKQFNLQQPSSSVCTCS